MRGVIRFIWILVVLFCLVISPAFAIIGSGDLSTGHDIEVMDETSWEAVKIANYQVNQLPDPAEPGGYVELRWKVENLGRQDANDVMFEILPSYPFTLDPGADAIQRVGSFYDRQIGDDGLILYYRLKVDENAVEGSNPVRIRYSVDGGENWVMFDFDIRIQTHDAILQVNDISVDSMIPGSKSSLKVTVENLAGSYLKDLKFRLDLTSVPFAPIGSSNQKVVEIMAPGEVTSIFFDIAAESDAESKVYKIPVDITYNDELGETYTSSNTIGVMVGDKPDLLVQVESNDLQADKTELVSIKVVNRGLTNVKLMTMHLGETKDYEVNSPLEYYIGSVDSDDYESAEFKLKKKTSKDIELPLKITYKDANNNPYSEEMKLKLKPSPAQNGSSSFVGIILMVAIVIGGFFAFRHFRKKKK